MAKKTRVLIDADNMAHRMRHAYSELVDERGRPTGVLYGTIKMLETLENRFAPDEVLFCFDGPGSWRFRVFSEYKKKRCKRIDNYTGDELKAYDDFRKIQLGDLRKFLRWAEIPCVKSEYCEADDTIAAIVKHATGNKFQNVVVSTDKDFLQLASRWKTRIWNPVTDAVYFEDSYGRLRSSLEIDPLAPTPKTYLWRRAVTGDSTDDIPGLRGVGRKRVLQWVPDAPQCGETPARYMKRHGLSAGTETLETIERNLRLMDLRFEYSGSVPHRDVAVIRTRYIEALRTVVGSCTQTALDPISDKLHGGIATFLMRRAFTLPTTPGMWKEFIARHRAMATRQRATAGLLLQILGAVDHVDA